MTEDLVFVRLPPQCGCRCGEECGLIAICPRVEAEREGLKIIGDALWVSKPKAMELNGR